MSESIELNNSKNKYFAYIINHINKVQESWKEIKDIISICKDNPDLISLIDSQIIYHDSIKFCHYEFDRYRRKFYPINDDDKISDDEFNIAVNHHYSHSPHHPEYYKLHPEFDVIDNSRIAYTIEMICDWMACGKDHGNTALEWYNSNKDRFNFRQEIKDIVEKTLYEIYEK